MTQPHASVIILTRNGMPLFQRCLNAVLSQRTTWPFEVIVIDSRSTDGTWELAVSRAHRTVQISPTEFNHGETRNLGARLARGKFLVFLVQDAIPTDERWLAVLVAACDRPGVAGSYSRQIPRPESELITKHLCEGTTPSAVIAETKQLPTGVRLGDLPPNKRLNAAIFQDNSSCLKRDVWETHPFAPLRYGEDIEWGKRVIEAGFAIAYEPSSSIFHSHDRSPLYYLKRAYADHYQAAELFDFIMIPSIIVAAKSLIHNLLGAWRFGLRQDLSLTAKLKFAASASIYVTCLVTGQFVGPRMPRTPRRPRLAEMVDDKLRAGV